MQIVMNIKHNSADKNTARELNKYVYADSLLLKEQCPAVTGDFDQCTFSVSSLVYIAATGLELGLCGIHTNCAVDRHHKP